MSADNDRGTWVRWSNIWRKGTSMFETIPFTPVSPETPDNQPGIPIRISSGDGVSHHGCVSGGGTTPFPSFGSSSEVCPTRSGSGRTRNAATGNRYVFTKGCVSSSRNNDWALIDNLFCPIFRVLRVCYKRENIRPQQE